MIREKDGIHINTSERIVADSRNASGDINIVSHAHFDHLHTGDARVVCSEETARIGSKRAGKELRFSESYDSVKLIPSGHIVGSRAALVEHDGRKILYTGDVSTRDRFYLDGFKPVDTDVLVLETTYGIPAYKLPPQEEVERNILDWVESNTGPLVLFGYSLGKAQKIQHFIQENTGRELLAHEKVMEMNDAVEESTKLNFDAVPLEENKDIFESGGILVAPPGSMKGNQLQDLVRETGALTAGFSGWAVNSSMGYSRYDRAFPLSDHCGFNELVELVEKVDPEKVYTHHGFDEAFASYLRKEKRINARSLKKNQSSLDEF